MEHMSGRDIRPAETIYTVDADACDPPTADNQLDAAFIAAHKKIKIVDLRRLFERTNLEYGFS